MKALIIEDTMTSLALVSHQLQRLGIDPIQARDGESGIEAFRRERPDLVLLDIIMPGMDGMEVARRLRALERAGEWTPIIFLTGLAGDENLEKALVAGGDDYLLKPVSETVLRAKVRAMQRIMRMRHSLVQMSQRLDSMNRELLRLSQVDGLTGIANRRCFDAALEREWRRALRSREPVSCMIVDVDFFKQYNDTYGHLAGDECLKLVASSLAGQLRRASDLAARYGGEEFAALMPGIQLGDAQELAAMVCRAVRGLEIPHASSKVDAVITVSIGVATAQPTHEASPIHALLEHADHALYQAKRGGRNRCAAGAVAVRAG
ncbi:MAG: diguanylate cyclase [Rhodocyclaceae bacterium]|nr:diguanylate cyclase [Rhodocyclaceae bacterium]MBX3668914.1 diguanylate cyclase [Rhodocyclaceae bacterium]